MTKVLKLLLLILTGIFLVENSSAQTDNLNIRAKVIYVEALPIRELGTAFTANFDFRLHKKQDGLGLHGGVGISKTLFKGSTVYIPFGINALIGKKAPHYFETALNFLGIFYSKYFNNATNIVTLPTLAYRFQPLNSGPSFRIFACPFISFKKTYFITAGISLGYKF